MKPFLIAALAASVLASATAATAGIVEQLPADHPFCKENPQSEKCPYNFSLPAEQNPKPRYVLPVEEKQPKPQAQKRACSADGQACNRKAVIDIRN